MTAHTPGPWFHVYGLDVDPTCYEFFGTESLVIAGEEDGEIPRLRLDPTSGHGTDGWTFIATVGSAGSEADARLIAAAPDLLAELKQLRANIEAEGWELAESPAIAKAEGRS